SGSLHSAPLPAKVNPQTLRRQKAGSAAKEGAEKIAGGRENVPQRLKPHCKRDISGTLKPCPSAKRSFSSLSDALSYLEGRRVDPNGSKRRPPNVPGRCA